VSLKFLLSCVSNSIPSTARAFVLTIPRQSLERLEKTLTPAKGPSDSLDLPKNATAQRIYDFFGCLPRSTDRLTIDTPTVIANEPHQERVFKTIRKTVQLVSPEGVLRQLPPYQEYTFFDKCVYVFTHAYSIAHGGPKKAEIFLRQQLRSLRRQKATPTSPRYAMASSPPASFKLSVAF
jgi:hypothetical protein